VRNPKEYNPHTRMPNFRFSDDQAEAITAYLVDVSSRAPLRSHTGHTRGNAERGKNLWNPSGAWPANSIGEADEGPGASRQQL